MGLIDSIELKRAISVAAMSNKHKTLEQIIDEQPTIEERKTGTPCDLCRHNPPSSGDGKPCSYCPAE